MLISLALILHATFVSSLSVLLMDQQQPGSLGFTQGLYVGSGSGMCLTITSTTGSPLDLTVPRGETVEGLRTRISQKLRVHPDRIVILHKDRQLTSGKLLALGVANGSKLTLIPVIEAGLSTSRCDRNAVDALESLTDMQITDFLSGRSPLNIIMGIGAHLMYVQLQLSEQAVAEVVEKQHHSNSKPQPEKPTTLKVNCTSSASTCFNTYTRNKNIDTAQDSYISSVQNITQKTGISSDMTVSTSHLTSNVNLLQHYYPPQTKSAPTSHSSAFFSPSECPHVYSPLPATTAITNSNGSTGSNKGPPSPVSASTFTEGNVQPSSSTTLSGAVIESFESHSPGVFTGSFSGTLAPYCQSPITHPRPGVAIIVQILNDLLRAACVHKGALANISIRTGKHSPDLNANPQHRGEDACKPRTKPFSAPSTEQFSEAPGNSSSSHCMLTAEKQMLHYKLEHLQFLMNQKRLYRQTRRSSHPSRIPPPYQHRNHCFSLSHGQKRSSYSHNSGPL